MSRTASAALTGTARETKWTVISGAMLGSVRLMNAGSFTIGRSPDCEFVIISDPKCSRKHAAVEWNAGGCEITSLNAENLVTVNDQPIGSTFLSDGDVVLLGTTKVQFNTTSMTDDSSIRHRQLSVVTSYSAPTPQARAPRPSAPRTSRRAKPSAGKNKLIIYGIIGAVIAYVVLSDPAKKKELLKLRTEQQVTADIEAANKMQEAALNLPSRRFEQSITAKQAQENFVRGFRDYRKGQYERSLDAFQACLALDPSHILCNRYIRLSQRRFNELVQYNIVLGRKYRDQNQFKPCMSSFRNVMVMVKDANSASYKEAKANYDACSASAEGRF